MEPAKQSSVRWSRCEITDVTAVTARTGITAGSERTAAPARGRQRLRSYHDRIFAPIDHFDVPMPVAGTRLQSGGEIATDISNREFDIGPARRFQGRVAAPTIEFRPDDRGGGLSAPKRKQLCPQNIRCHRCDCHTRTERSKRVSIRIGRLRGRCSRAVGREGARQTWLERGR